MEQWAQATITTLGFSWMAFWAFALGYLTSSLTQVLVTRSRMQETMGTSGPKSVFPGTFFGFISSSCSFAALSTTRALFQKGAGLVPSLAFLLSSTNVVIELGIVIAIFLGWQFVVGEYVGGVLLILFAWLLVKLTRPHELIRQAREKLEQELKQEQSHHSISWQDKLRSLSGWQEIGQTYVMEWQMVWKDVLIGFTIAGLIATFVPESFFTTLFIGSGGADANDTPFWQLVAQTLVGPIAAFFTFIGSMGNIPLDALLFNHGVSFAGVMAFIFSDLVVLPVLRINARYYGWPMSLYILGLLLTGLVGVSLLMHYGFMFFDTLPDFRQIQKITERNMFKLDYGFLLNIIFLLASAIFIYLWRSAQGNAHEHSHHEHGHDHSGHEHGHGGKALTLLALLSALWLAAGLAIHLTATAG